MPILPLIFEFEYGFCLVLPDLVFFCVVRLYRQGKLGRQGPKITYIYAVAKLMSGYCIVYESRSEEYR